MGILDIFKKKKEEERVDFSETNAVSHGSQISYKFKTSQMASLMSLLAVAAVGGILIINANRFNATPQRSQAAASPTPSPSPSPSPTPSSLPKFR